MREAAILAIGALVFFEASAKVNAMKELAWPLAVHEYAFVAFGAEAVQVEFA